MTKFPQVWMSPDTTWATLGSAPYAALSHHGYLQVTDAAAADVIVVGPTANTTDGTLAMALENGVGLVVLITDRSPPAPWPTGTGIEAGHSIEASGTDGRTHGLSGAAGADATPAGLYPQDSWAPRHVGEDLLARVDPRVLTPTMTLQVSDPASVLLRLPGTSRNPGAPVAATSVLGRSRVVVLGVAIDARSGDLLLNAITHAARRRTAEPALQRADITLHPGWLALKTAVTDLRSLQSPDGSISDHHDRADLLLGRITAAVEDIAPEFPHDADYLAAVGKDLTRWSDGGFAVPDFLDSLLAFHPETQRIDGRRHLVLFPMYTQNGNPDRNLEAVLIEVLWPDFVGDLEAGDYSNKQFLPIRFLDFTAGYATNSAVLFPETIAMREVPKFGWGAIFADREAARFRSVVTAAAEITGLAVPPDAARLLADQQLAEQTFVMWDLIHDRTHMHGDLPFDPFMIKQRMPYFLYTLEELRCDLTAFREAVDLEAQGLPQGRLVQYAILFDRIFRFAITGSRVRNYDGLGGQLLFAWLHQRRVLHWTDNRLTINWSEVTEPVLELGRQIERLYWQSIDRSKTAHWLAAYQLVSATVAPDPRSTWAKGPDALPLDGPPKGLTDAVLPDEFPLSMFYEALNRKLSPVVAATVGITG